MYQTLITKVETTLASVAKVKQTYAGVLPNAMPTKFPAVFYKPAGFSNDYETQNENMAIYRFSMLVMVGLEQTTVEAGFGVLADTVDDIITQFNQDWDQGSISGHRVTTKIESPEEWNVLEGDSGRIVVAPLSVEARLLTSI